MNFFNNTYSSYLIMLLSLFSLALRTQPYGLNLDDVSYEDTPIVDGIIDRGGASLLSVNLQPYCPVPGDQGSLPSCVAWSLANGLAIQTSIRKNLTVRSEIERSRFSVSYIYNQIIGEGNCYFGASYRDGLDLLKKRGVCPENMLGYSKDCNPYPDSNHHAKALSNRIKGYSRVFRSKDAPIEKLQRILNELSRKHPVLVALRVPDQFRKVIPEPRTPWLGKNPHAMLVVGYDELSQNITLMNSYGVNWGEGGFFKMDFDTFSAEVLYGYVLSL